MIIVAGEALVDLVIETDGSVSAALGGAPFNTARAAARLGAPVEFVGTLSVDRFGSLLANQLEADRVGLAFVHRTGRPTTLAAAELDEGGAASYRFYIEGTSAPVLEAHHVGALPTVEVLFTGGLGLVLEPMASTLTAMVASAHPDTLVVLDVNCRPAVIGDRADYLARLDRVIARADVVKVSDEDLSYLAPDLEPLDAARSILGRGPAAVLVTAGAHHTTVLTAAGDVDVPVLPVGAPVLDTIGAGDTFGGGFLAWWTTSGFGRADLTIEHLVDAVAAAHAAAAIVVTRRGANPPHRDELPADWAVPGSGDEACTPLPS